MSRRPARTRLVLPILTLGALAALTGCDALSSSDPDTADGPTEAPAASTAPVEPSAPSSTSASGSTGASGASGTARPTDSGAAAPATPAATSARPAGGPLLPAAELPGFNNEFFWSQGRTARSEPPDLAGTCHRVPLTSIGAFTVTYRPYRPPQNSDATAAETVATFADRTTAWRAYQTLLAWHDRCADRLTSYPQVDVGPVQQVVVDDPAVRGAAWYLLTYGPIGDDPDTGAFDAQGLALRGKRVAVLSMVLYGQDYDYPSGEEPMVEAVRRAAARLG